MDTHFEPARQEGRRKSFLSEDRPALHGPVYFTFFRTASSSVLHGTESGAIVHAADRC